MPVMKDETGGVKQPKPAPPKKPTAPVSKPTQPVKPAPKQPAKPTPAAPAGSSAQSGQVGTAKPKPQAAPTPTAKPLAPKAAPVKPAKPQLASGKPTLKPVSLRHEQELMNNPMLKKIDRKMKEHPDLFGAVVRGSASPEKAFDKMFAMWGRDEEMDAKALKAFKTNGNFMQQDNVDEDELTLIVADVLSQWDEMVATRSIDPNDRSVAAFRALSDLVASHTGDDLESYMYIMNTLLLGYSTTSDPWIVATRGFTRSDLPNVLPQNSSRIQIGTGGLAADYYDYGDYNQIGNHIWAYIATGANPGNSAEWNDLIGTIANLFHDGAQEVVGENLLRLTDVSSSWADVLAGAVGLSLGLRLRTGETTPSEFGEQFEEAFTQPYLDFAPVDEVFDLFEEGWGPLGDLALRVALGVPIYGDYTVYAVDILEMVFPLRDLEEQNR